jgi:hypothetical protein
MESNPPNQGSTYQQYKAVSNIQKIGSVTRSKYPSHGLIAQFLQQWEHIIQQFNISLV